MDEIESLLNRPKYYNNIDGLGELGGGFMALSFGFIQWMQVRSPAHSAWHSMWVFCIYFGSMWAIHRYGTKAIKEHITYPRTGFVEYRKRDRVWPIASAKPLQGLPRNSSFCCMPSASAPSSMPTFDVRCHRS